jgi:hypothetical protein
LSTKGGILMGLEIMGREGFMVDESRELLAWMIGTVSWRHQVHWVKTMVRAFGMNDRYSELEVHALASKIDDSRKLEPHKST